jgi:hypothetical protein
MTIETVKNQKMGKLISKGAIWTNSNVTPVNLNSVNYKKKIMFGMPSESEMSMIKQINGMKRKFDQQL